MRKYTKFIVLYLLFNIIEPLTIAFVSFLGGITKPFENIGIIIFYDYRN